MKKKISATIISAGAALGNSCALVQADEPSRGRLPSGFYIYTGRIPGASPPRYLLIGDDGSWLWDSTAGASVVNNIFRSSNQTVLPTSPLTVGIGRSASHFADRPEPVPQPTPRTNETVPKGEFEQYEFPWTSVLEGRGEANISEEDYRNARDYSVK